MHWCPHPSLKFCNKKLSEGEWISIYTYSDNDDKNEMLCEIFISEHSLMNNNQKSFNIVYWRFHTLHPLSYNLWPKNMLHKDCSLCVHDGNKPWNNFLHHAEISITVIGIVNSLSLLRSPRTLQWHANLFSDYQAIEWVCARWKLAIINATRGLWTIAILDQVLFLIKNLFWYSVALYINCEKPS